ncbi:mitochondrial carrier domain-containing protein [Lactarius deliciosus]|nr:mitochondrial carrier domain-containing protein [Lactarius deliciosus]
MVAGRGHPMAVSPMALRPSATCRAATCRSESQSLSTQWCLRSSSTTPARVPNSQKTSVRAAHVHPESLLPTELLPNTCHHHAFTRIGAGMVTMLCMNPLDLLKVKFQVSTRGPEGGIGCGIWRALCDIHASEGWRGLYRGLSPNVAGSWGIYFLFYNQLKRRTTVDAPDRPVTASQYFLFSSEASPHSFFSFLQTSLTAHETLSRCRYGYSYKPDRTEDPGVLSCGVRAIFHDEGWGRLYRRTLFSLTGARQFMAHEKTKVWAFERKRRCIVKLGPRGRRTTTGCPIRLMQLFSACRSPARCARLTPYQVIYSRTYGLVNAYAGRLGAGTHHCTIPSTIARTWTHEGLAGFYRGLATNLVRVPLGTCVTFVVYENIAWLLKHAAARREAHRGGGEGSQ